MINPRPATVLDLLSLATHFVVPKFQRDYAWGKEEASEFIGDLNETISKSSHGLFLGTMILNTSQSNKREIEVVDGQQRLTTVFLLLIACRQRAKALGNQQLATVIQQRLTPIDPATAECIGSFLHASESIKDVFQHMTNSDWDGQIPHRIDKYKQVKRQASRIRPAYEELLKATATLSNHELSRLLDSLYKARLIVIDIGGTEEAFEIFERTNGRGADLEISDLLKNYLYQQKVPELDEKWKKIVDNADGTILRMLKYFYMSEAGYVGKSELYRKLKERYRDPKAAETLANRLFDFSKFYWLLRQESTDQSIKEYFSELGSVEISGHQERVGNVNICLQALRLFNVSQVYPVAYAALMCYLRLGGAEDRNSSKKFIDLLATLEKYHFVNSAVCGRAGNEVEHLYADYCEKFAISTDFIETVNQFTNDLIKKLASKEDFETNFCEITYSTETIGLLAYIFDRFSNYGLEHGQRIPVYSPGHTKSNNNIEHFLAKKAEATADADPDALEFVDNIGNLLAINFRINSSLGNLSPAQKIEKLSGMLEDKIQNSQLVREFIKNYGGSAATWNKTAIMKRAQDLAIEAYSKIWKINKTAAAASG